MITDYIPHGIVVAFGTVLSYVFRDHVKRDDQRFAELREENDRLGDKLDAHFLAMSDQLTNIALEAGKNAAQAAVAAIAQEAWRDKQR